MSALCGEGKVSMNRGPNRKSETPHPLNAQKKDCLVTASYHPAPTPCHLSTLSIPSLPAPSVTPPPPCSFSYHLGVWDHTINGLDSQAAKPGIDK